MLLNAEEYRQSDKQALASLVKLGVASTRTQGKTLDLNTNEEITRMIPILCACFSHEELDDLFGEELTATILNMHRTEVLQNLFLEEELQHILRIFHDSSTPLLLFKGPALAYTVYPEPHLRTYHDIDALIRQDDLAQAHALLTQRGYTFYEEFRANVQNKKRVGYNYVLKHPDSWLETLVELHTAPHSGEIETTFDVDALWEHAQPIEVLGEVALTMHPIDHLLYLCWHYRFHSFSRLLWLYDLVMLLRTTGPQLDWDALMQSARRQHLATTLYYCLTWCRDIFSVAIPQKMFTQLRPPLASRLIVERFIPEPALALAATSWQPRRILAHRAMVDSTLDLLKTGLRAFFPTADILALRYMDRSHLPLRLFFLFYLIHPFITLWKGIRYITRRRLRENAL